MQKHKSLLPQFKTSLGPSQLQSFLFRVVLGCYCIIVIPSQLNFPLCSILFPSFCTVVDLNVLWHKLPAYKYPSLYLFPSEAKLQQLVPRAFWESRFWDGVSGGSDPFRLTWYIPYLLGGEFVALVVTFNDLTAERNGNWNNVASVWKVWTKLYS